MKKENKKLINKNNKKVLISVKNLNKTFKLPQEKHNSVKQLFLGIFKKKHYVEQHVLKDINFDIYEGDFFGIIGRNGSGKSTLLKILAKIYTCDSGSVDINGKISPFLELGVGFNPELTGWENIYLNGALLGLERKEIDEKIDEIIEFSELRDFMDQKLKNYSSGMQVRLAFSVAIHAHAPIILLDEVLAVGDANFQTKCQEQFIKMKKEGKTIVFVTHDMNAVKKNCNKAILISNGSIVAQGDPEKVSYQYIKLNANSEIDKNINNNDNQWGNRKVEITGAEIKNESSVNRVLNEEDDFELVIKIKNNEKNKNIVNTSIGIYKEDMRIFDTSTYFDGNTFELEGNKEKEIKLILNNLQLLKGDYTITLLVFKNEPEEVFHAWKNVINFTIIGDKKQLGVVNLNYKWEI